MSRPRGLSGRASARWKLVRRRLRRLAIRQDLGEGWLVIAIAALMETYEAHLMLRG